MTCIEKPPVGAAGKTGFLRREYRRPGFPTESLGAVLRGEAGAGAVHDITVSVRIGETRTLVVLPA
jgi:hypothetical protein